MVICSEIPYARREGAAVCFFSGAHTYSTVPIDDECPRHAGLGVRAGATGPHRRLPRGARGVPGRFAGSGRNTGTGLRPAAPVTPGVRLQCPPMEQLEAASAGASSLHGGWCCCCAAHMWRGCGSAMYVDGASETWLLVFCFSRGRAGTCGHDMPIMSKNGERPRRRPVVEGNKKNYAAVPRWWVLLTDRQGSALRVLWAWGSRAAKACL